jgi:AraC family ethanolamine operon transcriptional activator
VLRSTRLVRLRFDTPVAFVAQPVAPHPNDLFQIGLTSSAPDRLIWQGRSMRPDTLMAKAGGDDSNFALPTHFEFIVARLERERIESLTRLLRGGEDESGDRAFQIYPQPAPVLAELRSLLRALLRGDLLSRIDVLDSAECELYERVAIGLAARPEPIQAPPETRRRALRRAEEYMHAHAGERISLTDLCAASECCQRTLRQVFHECYGTSPMTFLKRLRLQYLRQDLRDATPRSTTVIELALRWGFWHLGHLGQDYRSLFGETPAQTLARSHASGVRQLRTAERGVPVLERPNTP